MCRAVANAGSQTSDRLEPSGPQISPRLRNATTVRRRLKRVAPVGHLHRTRAYTERESLARLNVDDCRDGLPRLLADAVTCTKPRAWLRCHRIAEPLAPLVLRGPLAHSSHVGDHCP